MFYNSTYCRFFLGHAMFIRKRRKANKNDEDPALELYNEW